MSDRSTYRRRKILIIDDDPLYRSLLSSMLREQYLVFVAKDGEEGFRKALTHPPDVAVIDICMPGWDGLKTLRAMRQCESLRNLPVMMLTSDASRETVIAAIHAGATDYLIKSSFSKEDFHRKLGLLIENNWRVAAAGVSRNRLESILDKQNSRIVEERPRIPEERPTSSGQNAVEVNPPAPKRDEGADLQEIMDAWD